MQCHGSQTRERRIPMTISCALQVQARLQKIASTFESFNSLFQLSDFFITLMLLVGSGAVMVVLWLVPFSWLMAVGGCFVLRHPRFRDPLPAKPLCLASRLPDKQDTMVLVKG